MTSLRQILPALLLLSPAAVLSQGTVPHNFSLQETVNGLRRAYLDGRQKLDAESEKLRAAYKSSYLTNLEKLQTDITKQGNLDAALLVKGERERVTAGSSTSPDQVLALPVPAKTVRATYDASLKKLAEDVARLDGDLRSKCVADFDTLQKRLTAAGLLDQALEARREKERFAAERTTPVQQQVLFNGKDLTGWEGNRSLWSVKDGVIHGETVPDPADPQKSLLKTQSYLVWKGGSVSDFELRLKFRIPSAEGNSGIQYRSKILGELSTGPQVGGYQAEIDSGKFADKGIVTGMLQEERGRGILARFGQKVRLTQNAQNPKTANIQVTGSTGVEPVFPQPIRSKEWNEYVIIAKGNHLQQFINGKLTVDVTDDDPAGASEGVIAFQLHNSVCPAMVVEFKDIVLTKFEKETATPVPSARPEVQPVAAPQQPTTPVPNAAPPTPVQVAAPGSATAASGSPASALSPAITNIEPWQQKLTRPEDHPTSADSELRDGWIARKIDSPPHTRVLGDSMKTGAVRAEFQWPASGNTGNLSFRNSERGYYLSRDRSGVILRFENIEVGRFDAPTPKPNELYKLELRMSGMLVTGFLDGEEVIRVDDDLRPDTSTIFIKPGIFLHDASVRNIEVLALTSSIKSTPDVAPTTNAALPARSSMAGINTLTSEELTAGWQLLFDGKDPAKNWRGFKKDILPGNWAVREGELVCQKVTSSNSTSDLVSKEQFESFELSIDWKISTRGNSGVMFRVQETETESWKTGPEVQLLDNLGGRDPIKAGWLYKLYSASVDSTKPVGEWNNLRLICKNGKCEHWLNGTKYLEYEIGSADWNEKVADSPFKALPGFAKTPKGHICLQDHGDQVWFRNIKIRPL
ncbi:MAG: family 16 glycoside hydrolase [Verrucomicrobiota bacterium]